LDRRTKPKLRGASPGSPPGAEAPWRFTLGPCRAEARAVLRWIPAQAETCAVLLRKAPWPKPQQLSFGFPHRPKPKQVSFWIPAPAEAFAGFLDRRSGRNPGGVPGSRLGPKPLPFTVRCPASGRSPGGSPVRKARAGRSQSVFSGRKVFRPKPAIFPVGSPSKPKLWRFASEAPCRPKPIGFSGVDPLQDRSPSGSPLAVP
jgi:hypothetical protein